MQAGVDDQEERRRRRIALGRIWTQQRLEMKALLRDCEQESEYRTAERDEWKRAWEEMETSWRLKDKRKQELEQHLRSAAAYHQSTLDSEEQEAELALLQDQCLESQNACAELGQRIQQHDEQTKALHAQMRYLIIRYDLALTNASSLDGLLLSPQRARQKSSTNADGKHSPECFNSRDMVDPQQVCASWFLEGYQIREEVLGASMARCVMSFVPLCPPGQKFALDEILSEVCSETETLSWQSLPECTSRALQLRGTDHEQLLEAISNALQLHIVIVMKSRLRVYGECRWSCRILFLYDEHTPTPVPSKPTLSKVFYTPIMLRDPKTCTFLQLAQSE